MDEEKYLKEVYGTSSPFKVPDGYFKDFADSMMSMLPERRVQVVEMKTSAWRRWRPYAAAACFCAVIMGGGIFLMNNEKAETRPLASTVASADGNMDEADYVMLDKNDIYTYLADY